MPRVKLLLAPDLHYCKNLAEEIAANRDRLPADTYDHQVEGKLFWHNEMMVEAGEQLCDGLARLVRQEAPDLVVLLGDLVNTNWEANVAAVAQRAAALPCPVRMVTGNHDIYLGEPACRLQDVLAPGTYTTGLRHEQVNGLGLIYLDLFAYDPLQGSAADYRKWTNPHADERVDYRPGDALATLDLVATQPETPWLVLGHFPMTTPEPRVEEEGRKIGRRWPGGKQLAVRLDHPDNLLGIVCGHQHFAHFQRFAHGFHWTLPSLVEYPCAAGVLEWTGDQVCGRTVTVDGGLAAASLCVRQAAWTAGQVQDRQFTLNL
jgi:hypothetical protein